MPNISLKDIPLTNDIIGKMVYRYPSMTEKPTGVITFLFKEDESPYSVQVRLNNSYVLSVFKPEELYVNPHHLISSL